MNHKAGDRRLDLVERAPGVWFVRYMGAELGPYGFKPGVVTYCHRDERNSGKAVEGIDIMRDGEKIDGASWDVWS